MANATEGTAAPDARPTSAKTCDPLPYAHLDIVGHGANEYCAGNAMLAELTRGWIETQAAADVMGMAEREALGEAAQARHDRQTAEFCAPAQDLGHVAVKIAYALRLSWYATHGEGTDSDASLAVLGMALSDVILLREAEAERRRQVGGRAS